MSLLFDRLFRRRNCYIAVLSYRRAFLPKTYRSILFKDRFVKHVSIKVNLEGLDYEPEQYPPICVLIKWYDKTLTETYFNHVKRIPNAQEIFGQMEEFMPHHLYQIRNEILFDRDKQISREGHQVIKFQESSGQVVYFTPDKTFVDTGREILEINPPRDAKKIIITDPVLELIGFFIIDKDDNLIANTGTNLGKFHNVISDNFTDFVLVGLDRKISVLNVETLIIYPTSLTLPSLRFEYSFYVKNRHKVFYTFLMKR